MTTARAELPARRLEALRDRLNALLHLDLQPPRLGGVVVAADELIVCGVVGGKDVGKSTLIGALCERDFVGAKSEVARGTNRAVAYVHEEEVAALRARLRRAQVPGGLDVHPHDQDALRGLALLDLPDFDSEFTDHREIVESILPALDRVLWMVTPRKIGDRAWVQLYHQVAKDAGNVYLVLGKLDELLADGDLPAGSSASDRARAFRDRERKWIDSVIGVAQAPEGERGRFLVAARFPDPDAFLREVAKRWDDEAWRRFEADRETVRRIGVLAAESLDRLRQTLLAPLAPGEAAAVKRANARAELQAGASALRRRSGLDAVLGAAEEACAARSKTECAAAGFDESFQWEAAREVRRAMRKDVDLADDVLEARVQRYPLLRIAYFPLGFVARAIGRGRASSSGGGDADLRGSSSRFRAGALAGATLGERVRAVRARQQEILGHHQAALQAASSDAQCDRAAERLNESLRVIAPTLETDLVEEVASGGRRSSVLLHVFLWATLLWFPFVQPVAEGVLRILEDGGAVGVIGGLLSIVTALSAVHLASGFIVVAVVFAAVLALMYMRSLREIRAAAGERSGDDLVLGAIERAVETEVIAPLWHALEARRSALDAVARELAELEGDTEDRSAA